MIKGFAFYAKKLGFYPKAKESYAMILDFPAYRIVRNKCLIFKILSLLYFCCSKMNGLRRCILALNTRNG